MSKCRCCRHEPQPKNGRAMTALTFTARHCRRVNASCKRLSSLWVCVSVCGTAWRQELLWGFICGMTRQPVIYEHLELLFKHSLISRQTFPEARAEQELLGPDKTSHRLSASHPTREPSVGCASWEQPVKTRLRVSAASTTKSNSVTLQWRRSSAPSSFSFLANRASG